jgi:hypothetical protein
MLVLMGGVLSIVHILGGVLAGIGHTVLHTLDCVGWH